MNGKFRLMAFLLALSLAVLPLPASASSSFIGSFNTVSVLASTVPSNGDVNPYGVVVVPRTIGKLVKGDVLVSNFNNQKNQQGTGTTIVEVSPNSKTVGLFAQISASQLPGSCPGGVGLTTALVIVHQRWVIVGSLPTSDGTSATAKAGCLIVLNQNGRVVETISGSPINGPWDMTARDTEEGAVLFVANVLNGTVAASPKVVDRGTVARIDLRISDNEEGGRPVVTSRAIIGSGFPEVTDPNALVIGPTGLALARDGTLYVADTINNRIAAIHNAASRTNSAGTGVTVTSAGGLNGPLGLAIAPDGDILAANAGDGNLVEVTPAGVQFPVKTVESLGAGTLFGLAIRPDGKGVYFVDDGTNALNLLH